MELEQGLDEEQARPLRRVRRRRHVEECPRPSKEAEGGDEVDQFGHVVDDHVGKGFGDLYAECFWGKDSSAVEVEIPIPESNCDRKYMFQNFESYVATSLNEGQWKCRNVT